ncbi:hypothetical protein AN619_23170 [Thermotalea metallivorans]|uniref:Uncharacterized protein n=1 Tax=Thermotalea metallivorans TaxID=520762 RepID=A0A140L1U1_9FIRM|nr:hypothetical protein AN619_23170 [Thermotalea metallivorans]
MKKIMEYLSIHNCVGIQVTLDGVEEKHNRSGPLRNGNHSFEIITHNINCFMQKIPFVIRCNYKLYNPQYK